MSRSRTYRPEVEQVRGLIFQPSKLVTPVRSRSPAPAVLPGLALASAESTDAFLAPGAANGDSPSALELIASPGGPLGAGFGQGPPEPTGAATLVHFYYTGSAKAPPHFHRHHLHDGFMANSGILTSAALLGSIAKRLSHGRFF